MSYYTKAIRDVFEERVRQQEAEGWTTQHDDSHDNGEMAKAAACYALSEEGGAPQFWPWEWSWWKPKTRREDLVRAAALLVAEIERHDRLAAEVAE